MRMLEWCVAYRDRKRRGESSFWMLLVESMEGNIKDKVMWEER